MFNPSRDQVRDFFFATWQKYQAQQNLTELEKIALQHIATHPEYHKILEQPERYQQHDWRPETGETNPFLHLSMHLSISEQLSIDQPIGIKNRYLSMTEKHGDEHAAQHEVMDCLAEMIWQAQRNNQPPNAQAYLECLDKKCHS
jgi:hypothetical protein